MLHFHLVSKESDDLSKNFFNYSPIHFMNIYSIPDNLCFECHIYLRDYLIFKLRGFYLAGLRILFGDYLLVRVPYLI